MFPGRVEGTLSSGKKTNYFPREQTLSVLYIATKSNQINSYNIVFCDKTIQS